MFRPSKFALLCACALVVSVTNATPQYVRTDSLGHPANHQTFCQGIGGKLATPKSDADQIAMHEFAKGEFATLAPAEQDPSKASHFHFGLILCNANNKGLFTLDCDGGNKYSWIDGTPYTPPSGLGYWSTQNEKDGGGDPWVVVKFVGTPTSASPEWLKGGGVYYGICEIETESAPTPCTETEANECHKLAYCENAQCKCPAGTIGDGEAACDTEGWTLRTLYDSGCAATDAQLESMRVSNSADAVISKVDSDTGMVEVNLLYSTSNPPADPSGSAALALASCTPWEFGTRKYTYVAGTSSNELRIPASGLVLDTVAYSSTCSGSPAGSAGCWVIDVIYTTGGPEAFNAFYFPHLVGNDAQSYDFNYAAADPTKYGTLQVANFPIATSGRTSTFDEFYGRYRPTDNFMDWADDFDTTTPKIINRPNYDESEVGSPADVAFPAAPESFLDGTFKGLTRSPGVVSTAVLDPFFHQYAATIEIEELDLRQLAGVMKGTASVEYTVDSFLGYVNFRPTGLLALDTMATQQALHMEKTSFFSVSTHGTNDYTFLEYVNLRLVSILNQDADTSDETTSETGSNLIFTNGTASAVYVQVTFTLGQHYRPNENEGLIPLASVRTAQGTFFSEVQDSMDHSCAEWAKAAAFTGSTVPDLTTYSAFADYSTFTSRLGQTCAPAASMCAGPQVAADLPDQFVSFNIPLGIDYLGVDQSIASSDLSENVFVHMVISAVDTDPAIAMGTPNDGDDAFQMKTTLSASIPVVDGGVNLFCDGVTAKTDLKEVAKAHLIIGTANTTAELSRLTFFEDIANTAMSPEDAREIDTDSIEASLMTLVVKGDADYFTNSGTGNYALELEDVITVHIMDPSATGTVFAKVKDMLASPGDDNDSGSGLDTNGYNLNGAFWFRIDREHNRAHLEPSGNLTSHCPFNPTPPTSGLSGYTCVTRRDIKYRGFPARVGASSTAMEISVADGVEEEARFMQTVLGGSDYAANLGRAYAGVIHGAHLSEGGADRYARAWWINPGYEWTPTQTQGTSIFSLSQQIVMFALINLNENYNDVGGGAPAALDLPAGQGSTFARRRMLLSNVESDQGTTSMAVKFDVSPKSLMASALNVPEERVGIFEVDMTLTPAEACLDVESGALRNALVSTFDDYLTTTASLIETVQIVSIEKDMHGERCNGGRRLLAMSAATAKVTMLVAFAEVEGVESAFNVKSFAEMPGIDAVSAVDVPSTISLDEEFKTTQKEKEQQQQEIEKAAADSNKESSGSDNTVLIAGICGGVAALLLAVGGVFAWVRSKDGEQTAETVHVHAISVQELKAQMCDDV